MKADLRETAPQPVAIAGASKPSDRASIRRSNLGLVLRLLRDSGPRSRSRIAADTGLPKPTITGLVSELADLGLVTESREERLGSIGRPGLTVEIDGRAFCGIGAEICVDYLCVVALTLRGDEVFQSRLPLDVRAAGPEAVLDALAGLIREALAAVEGSGARCIGVTVAAPGVVDLAEGIARYAPNIGWSDVAVFDGLRRRLGPQAPAFGLENDAKLGAVAEYLRVSDPEIHDMLYVSGEVGIGGGIISGGGLLRGSAGYSGEIGHMPLDPGGHPCVCGRTGCWETMIGLSALLREAADAQDPVQDPSRDLEARLADIAQRAAAGDERTLAALAGVAEGLALGLSLLIDVLNPRLVVLGGYFAQLGDYLIDEVRAGVLERVMAPNAGGCEIALSSLGFTSSARGGAYLALDRVYQDPSGVAGSS
ncbi:ROK family transcriptional regulator [Actinospica sp. MGRD01-02]|uniref:ROK family transcriptional regulator n=1 Tax=Actinospica acidithermotolerans TaxID=2828514 RepID=A0A941E4R4_9ACTN|nr:ROK family transcriptional regulator [Actinospica acidithermotolerans]MBR7825141.1 ROK family transcriptional regulator [Actinospica acidithermotolerans]